MGLSSNMFTQGQRVKLWGVMPEAFVKANITCLTVGQDRTAERGRACSRGSVRARASKYSLCSRTCGNVPSRGFQDGQHRHAAAEEVESAAIGGNVLVVAGARAEKVAEFIVSATEPGGRSRAFEAPHRAVAAFDAAVVLLPPVVQVGAGPVPPILAQRGPDRGGVAVAAIRRDPVPRHSGHRFGGAEQRLRGCHVAVLA